MSGMRLSGGWLEFGLNIEGYQFPELANEPNDSDWLNIRVSLSHVQGRWSHREKLDPSLETFEVQWLIEWLEEVAAHAEVFKNWRSERLTSRIFFTELNLSFEALNGSYEGKALTLRVYLAAENLPPFKKDLHWLETDGEDPAEVWIDFPADAADLQQAAHALAEQLAKFPVRVGLPHHPSSQLQGD